MELTLPQLVVMLVFKKSDLEYAYKRYAYKKRDYNRQLMPRQQYRGERTLLYKMYFIINFLVNFVVVPNFMFTSWLIAFPNSIH